MRFPCLFSLSLVGEGRFFLRLEEKAGRGESVFAKFSKKITACTLSLINISARNIYRSLSHKGRECLLRLNRKAQHFKWNVDFFYNLLTI